MGEHQDIFMIFGVLILLGVAWAVTGGPERTERRFDDESGSRIVVETKQERSYRSLPQAEDDGTVAGDIYGAEDIKRELEKTEQELLRIQEELDYIREHGERSPYEGLVEIERVLGGAREENPTKEYLRIRAQSGNDERIIITGWRLESSITGRGATIPHGTPLPRSGSVNSESAIVLLPGDRAYIATGRSPIGASFRENICTGYFEQFQDFSPRLSKQCPDPDNELADFGEGAVSVTDDACYDFVRRIPRCTMEIDAPPLSVTNACWQFVTKNINYSGCVENHRGDENFFDNEWRIFLGRTEDLWRERRELIKLLDERGRVVDTLTY